MHYKGIVIKIVRCWHKNRTNSSKKYNKNPGNKSMHRWTCDLLQIWHCKTVEKEYFLPKMVLEQLGSYMDKYRDKNETISLSHAKHKNQLQIDYITKCER